MDIEKRAAELGIDDVRFTKRSHVLTGKWRLEDMTDDDILEVNDWLDFVEEHEKVAETAPSDVHQAADAKGVEWDDNKPFMDMSERVTGERRLDDMSEKQLEDVVAEIEKLGGDTGQSGFLTPGGLTGRWADPDRGYLGQQPPIDLSDGGSWIRQSGPEKADAVIEEMARAREKYPALVGWKPGTSPKEVASAKGLSDAPDVIKPTVLPADQKTTKEILETKPAISWADTVKMLKDRKYLASGGLSERLISGPKDEPAGGLSWNDWMDEKLFAPTAKKIRSAGDPHKDLKVDIRSRPGFGGEGGAALDRMQRTLASNPASGTLAHELGHEDETDRSHEARLDLPRNVREAVASYIGKRRLQKADAFPGMSDEKSWASYSGLPTYVALNEPRENKEFFARLKGLEDQYPGIHDEVKGVLDNYEDVVVPAMLNQPGKNWSPEAVKALDRWRKRYGVEAPPEGMTPEDVLSHGRKHIGPFTARQVERGEEKRAEIEKKAAHAKGRLKQRAPHVPHAVLEQIEAMAATLKLDPLRTYHAPLRGGGYAVLAPVGRPGRVKHVVKTVFSHGSRPPGIRLPGLPKLEKGASRTFTDKDQTYNVEKLWGSSGKPKSISPDALLKSTGRTWGHGKNKFGWKDVLSNPKKYPDHIKRIDTADLKQPILVHNGIVVDGIHRLVRAKKEGKKLLAINLSRSDMEGALTKKAFTDELEKLGGIRTQEILAALKQVATTMPQREHLRTWSRHAALNLGLAESGVAQAFGRNKGKPWVGSTANELKDALQSSIFAVLPPTHHTAKEMAVMLRHRHRDYYRYGAGRGKNPELMGKTSSFDPMWDGFSDELEKTAGFKDTLERLKKKVSAFDVGAALATAGLLGLTAADIRRGGFKGRGPHAEATAEFFERIIPAYEKMPGLIERMGLPKSRVRDIVRRITPDDIPKIEVITSKGDLSRRLGMTPEAAEKTWIDFEKGNAAAVLTSKGPSYLIASPRAPQAVIEHEVGHIVDKFRGGPNKALVDRAISLQSESMKDRVRARASHLAEKLFGPHHEKMVMSTERAAWEFVEETAAKADLMPAALKTYKTGFHAGRAPVALAASAGPAGLWAGVRGGEALLDKRKERIEKSASVSKTIIGDLIRRSGRTGASRKYDFGVGVLGERLRNVLLKEYGPSWSRLIPRKANKGIANIVAVHPELAPMLTIPGLPPGGPLVYAAPKLGLRKAFGIKKRSDLERLILRMAEKSERVQGIPGRKALTAGLLTSAGVGGLSMGALASHSIPKLTYHGPEADGVGPTLYEAAE